MKEKYDKEDQVALSEPKIKIYNSYDQMEELQLKQALRKDPLTGLRETVELILRVYGVTREDLNKRTRENRIRIVHYS
mgnify:CR=1 FL=1